MRILLVDDDPGISWCVGRCLTRAGCNVARCVDGADAIQLMGERQFDVLVTDIQMPRVNGIALIEWAIANRPQMRVIVMTGFGSPGLQRQVLAAGALLYLEKPFDPMLIVDLVRAKRSPSGFHGHIGDISLFDYLQLIALSQNTLVLRVVAYSGLEGTLFIDAGNVVHAICGDETGEDAFFRCMSFNGGTFATLPWREPERRTIQRGGDNLMLEAARILDEASRNEEAAGFRMRPTSAEFNLADFSDIPSQVNKDN